MSKSAEAAIVAAATAQTRLHSDIRDMLQGVAKGGTGSGGGGAAGGADEDEDKKADVWWRSFGKWVGDKYDSAKSKVDTATSWLGTLATGLMSVLLAPQMYETIAKKAKELLTWDNIKTAAAEAWNYMYDKGKDILSWVSDKLGLGPAIAKAGDAIKALGSAVDWLKDKLGFGSKKDDSHPTPKSDTNAHGTTTGGAGRPPPGHPAAPNKSKTSVGGAGGMVGGAGAVEGGPPGAASGVSPVSSMKPAGATAASTSTAMLGSKGGAPKDNAALSTPPTSAPTKLNNQVVGANKPAPGTPGSGYNSGAIDFGDGGTAGHNAAVAGHAWAQGNNSPANSYTNLSGARGDHTLSAPATSVGATPAVTVPAGGVAPADTAGAGRAAPVAQSTSTVGIDSFGINSGVDDSLALMNLGVISG